MKKPASWHVNALVGVRAEIIPLGLDKTRGQPVAAKAIVKRNAAGHCGHGYAGLNRRSHCFSPSVLAFIQRRLEIVVKKKRCQTGILIIRRLDPVQKRASYDTACPPYQCCFA
jgi:hypothetical protein